MKILMIVLNQTGIGTYWRAYYLAHQLSRLGHAITLISTSRTRRQGVISNLQDGINLVETPDLFSGKLRSGWDPWNVFNRIVWGRKQKLDLIHAFESRPTVIYPALYLAKQNNIPIVMDWSDWFGRGGLVEERESPIVRALLRPVETYYEEHFRKRAAGSTIICTALRDRAIELGIPPETILLLPNGASHEVIHPIPQEMARGQTGLSPDHPVVGFIGTIFHRDAQLMAQSFDLLADHIPDVNLLIIGYCPLDIKDLVHHPQQVIQTGYIDRKSINTYLAACDLFWLPLNDSLANRGRFPLKLTDYMACGRPTVATRVGDVADIIQKYSIGLVCEPDASEFASATIHLLTSRELRIEQGDRARNTAINQFSWSTMAEKLEQHYHTILRSSLNEKSLSE